MNKRNRAAAALLLMAAGAALGTTLALRRPAKLAGRVEDRSQVCMVNDKVLGRPQLPVVVEGKTYYGCCAGCVGRLNNDRKTRIAADPVTGLEVDKSEAVILQGERGEALYFESEETARRYQAHAGARN